jgi:hypothetical protein
MLPQRATSLSGFGKLELPTSYSQVGDGKRDCSSSGNSQWLSTLSNIGYSCRSLTTPVQGMRGRLFW